MTWFWRKLYRMSRGALVQTQLSWESLHTLLVCWPAGLICFLNNLLKVAECAGITNDVIFCMKYYERTNIHTYSAVTFRYGSLVDMNVPDHVPLSSKTCRATQLYSMIWIYILMVLVLCRSVTTFCHCVLQCVTIKVWYSYKSHPFPSPGGYIMYYNYL